MTQQFTLASAVVQLGVKGQQSFYAALYRAQQQAQNTMTAMQAGAQQAGTPQGQRQLQQLYHMQLAGQTAGTLANTAQLRAQANYLGGPAGTNQARAHAAAQAGHQQAQQQFQHAQNVALYGKTTADMMRFKEGLAKAAREFAPFLAGLAAAAALGSRLVAAASPVHSQTMSDSITLLMAKIGGDLIPAFERLIVAVQNTANWYDKLPRGARIGVGGQILEDQQNQRFPAWLRGGFLGAFGQGKPEMSGMPESRLMSHEQYGEGLMEAAASGDNLQTRLLQEQLQALVNAGVLLQRVADNSDQLRAIQPAFR